jgi:methionine-gamma-lyase
MRLPGAVVTFELAGGEAAGLTLQKALRLCTLTTSLGLADTVVSHPATTSHFTVPRKLRLEQGITDGLVRVSVGLEDAEDIVADFKQALEKVLASGNAKL